MEDPYLAEQDHGNTAACALSNFCAQFREERFNVSPLDIGARRTSEDQFKCALVSPLHVIVRHAHAPHLGMLAPHSVSDRGYTAG